MSDLNKIQEIGAQIQQVLSTMPDTNSVFAERVSQGSQYNTHQTHAEGSQETGGFD